MRQRSIIDQFGAVSHAIESEPKPAPKPEGGRLRQNERMIRVAQARHDAATMQYRQAQDDTLSPLRGFSAPILSASASRPSLVLPVSLTESERAAAEAIRQSLAHLGLLRTLAKAVELLGPAAIAANPSQAENRLRALGFPTDLLRFFQLPPAESSVPDRLIGEIARRLTANDASLPEALQAARFVFQKSHPGFRAAEETGDFEIGLIRSQIGGGYDHGLTPGGTLDVAGQLTAVLPQADFIFSVTEEFAESVRAHALLYWPLGRRNRVTLISEKTSVASWAQDNGKAGFIAGAGKEPSALATLAPRFATRNEVNSVFDPGESYLMDGLSAARHTVIHSPLLFQGGNLLMARDPARNRLVLLVSETVLRQNTALGLSAEQAAEALRLELGAEDCLVLAPVSYHLDYDVTLRSHNGKLVAFVNDIRGAARRILRLGFAALDQGGVLAGPAAARARAALTEEKFEALAEMLLAAIAPHRNSQGAYPARLARLFAAQPTDSAALNFRCFLAALDFWRSASPEAVAAASPAEREYLSALRDIEADGLAQQEEFRRRGWMVAPIPSFPDLRQSLNYLNGIHDRNAFLMPSVGGFYQEMDDAAAEAFHKALGPNVKIIRILNTDLQRAHGGIHCVASAYPKLPQ